MLILTSRILCVDKIGSRAASACIIINIMRLATEIEFAKGFACAAPAMYRNFSVITVYSVQCTVNV